MSDIIKFEFDQPVEVALRYLEPKVFPSNFAGGDDRHMFSTTDGRVMYHTPLTAARIKALGVAPGECFFICKRKNGRLTDWQVFRESAPERRDLPQATNSREDSSMRPERPINHNIERMPPADRARRLPELIAARNAERGQVAQPEAPSELERQLADSIAVVQARKQVAQAQTATAMPAWGETLVAHTNVLVDSFAAVLKHSMKHEGLVKPDDVRSMLLSAFINLSQKANRAA